ncbi:GAF domain-containing protein [Mycobacterium sp. NPDC048908]|uniref:GAF domain-containing protein n=1 Tax=Mycobacterium sp. NPDC048908 TaxID=3364292 RepID=UPI0037226E76
MSDTQEVLDEVDAQLDAAKRLEDVQHVAKTAARRLTGAQGATFVLLDGQDCYYADEDSMSPLWKGQRFPATHCISGWAMLHGTTVSIPDIRCDDRIPQAAYRPTFVRSLVMAPMLAPEPLGAIGAYWARPRQPSAAAVQALEQLAGLAVTALRRFPDGMPDPSFQAGAAP